MKTQKKNEFAILRHGKIKSIAGIRLAGQHNARKREVPNADPGRITQNRILMGSEDLVADWHAAMQRLSVKAPRKNSVLLVEQMLTASPGYFRPGNVEAVGTWQKDRLISWLEATSKFLIDQHGGRLVQVVLHLDESTPHIHAMILPAVNEDDSEQLPSFEQIKVQHRLSARDLFYGHKRLLQKQQDDYAEYLRGEVPLDL